MTSKRLDKKQRKQLVEFRRNRKNKRSMNAGEYGFGKTEDRKKQQREDRSYNDEDYEGYNDEGY